MGEWELYTLKLQRQVPAEVGDLSYPYEDRTFKAAQVAVVYFHERDLARSFIVFAHNHQEESNQLAKDVVVSSTAFKYKKFHHALQWYKENQSFIHASDESLISFAKKASDLFKFIFIAKVLCHDRVQEYNRLPITQDAAASAYQIMSYLLLNEDMARKTNLIPHPDGKIQDVYMSLLNEFKEFLHHQIKDKFKMEIIESKLDRKLIKSIFMPLIYGKTLISIISWFCSVMDRSVVYVYSIPYFKTIQDYMSFKKEKI